MLLPMFLAKKEKVIEARNAMAQALSNKSLPWFARVTAVKMLVQKAAYGAELLGCLTTNDASIGKEVTYRGKVLELHGACVCVYVSVTLLL